MRSLQSLSSRIDALEARIQPVIGFQSWLSGFHPDCFPASERSQLLHFVMEVMDRAGGVTNGLAHLSDSELERAEYWSSRDEELSQ